jgi:hypothetical protein
VIITNEQLDLLERISAGATKGPWAKGRSYESVVAPDGPDPRDDAKHYGGQLVAESVFGAGDIAFIVTAREAVPALCARVRELEANLAKAAG